MRKFLMLLFLAFSLPLFIKGQVVNRHQQELRAKTITWFKNVYVKNNFKDPYSFKLMDCTISPVTLKEKLEENDRDLMYGIIDVDTTSRFGNYQSTKREVEKYKIKYDLAVQNNDSSEIKFNKTVYEYELSKLNDILIKYEKITNLKKEVSELKLSSSDEDLKTTLEYRVYLDAYGKNSIGNNVLGKYYYTIDKNGTTTSEVKKLD